MFGIYANTAGHVYIVEIRILQCETTRMQLARAKGTTVAMAIVASECMNVGQGDAQRVSQGDAQIIASGENYRDMFVCSLLISLCNKSKVCFISCLVHFVQWASIIYCISGPMKCLGLSVDWLC